jgi:hypothetical protein
MRGRPCLNRRASCECVLGHAAAHRRALECRVHVTGSVVARRGDAPRGVQGEPAELAARRLPPAWRSAHMDLVKFMVSATSENKLFEAAWRCGSKLLCEYGLMMRREHHIDVCSPPLLFLCANGTATRSRLQTGA